MCGKCINKTDCLLYGKIYYCPNFKTQADSCEICTSRNYCKLKCFIFVCNGFKLDKKAVRK